MQWPENFKVLDFICPCGCETLSMDIHTILAVQKVRTLLGGPIRITSACRCPKHNAEVGGRLNSFHVASSNSLRPTIACAVDMQSYMSSVEDLYQAVLSIPEFFNGGIGKAKTFIHADTRGSKARWTY